MEIYCATLLSMQIDHFTVSLYSPYAIKLYQGLSMALEYGGISHQSHDDGFLALTHW